MLNLEPLQQDDRSPCGHDLKQRLGRRSIPFTVSGQTISRSSLLATKRGLAAGTASEKANASFDMPQAGLHAALNSYGTWRAQSGLLPLGSHHSRSWLLASKLHNGSARIAVPCARITQADAVAMFFRFCDCRSIPAERSDALR